MSSSANSDNFSVNSLDLNSSSSNINEKLPPVTSSDPQNIKYEK